MTMLIPSWIDDASVILDPYGYAERNVQWLKRLKHPKNAARGHAFALDPWQERIIRKLYGPRNADGTRIVRRLVLMLPRGNRKTSLCAAINLLHLIGPEREAGNLIVSAASAHEQAMELFNETTLIVENDIRLAKHLRIVESKSKITFAKSRSRYIAVASDGKVQHGKTPNVVIADELHAWEGRAGKKQWEALDSALVKVAGTLLIVATTSGRGQENLAWKTVDYAIKVQKGEIDDPATLPVIFMCEEGDDWKDEKVWHAVNPGMKHGYPNLASFRDKALKAIKSPSDCDSFLQFNLNRWLDHSTSPFVEMAIYDACKGIVDIEALRTKPCWLAVDLSSNSDLTTIQACFRDDDDNYVIQSWFFCPADNLKKRADKDGVPYPQWAADGFIIPTAGNVVDFRIVEQKIRDLCDEFDVQEIAFDPHLGRNMMQNLLEDGLPVVEMRQGWVTMAPAIKELEKSIIGGTFAHDGNPVLRWCFSNVAVETDKAENRSFHKGKSKDRIDGAVACAMAVGRASQGDTHKSIYSNPTARPDGLLFF
jgi:phage terminase large subunit-like protein